LMYYYFKLYVFWVWFKEVKSKILDITIRQVFRKSIFLAFRLSTSLIIHWNWNHKLSVNHCHLISQLIVRKVLHLIFRYVLKLVYRIHSRTFSGLL